MTIEALRNDHAYAELVANQFDTIVFENELKLAHTEPNRGQFDFADADFGIQFARARGMRVRGHTLVWHESVPAWLQTERFSPEELAAILEEHITTVVTHCRNLAPGSVYAWDVVNEAIDDATPTETRSANPFKPIGNGKDDFIRKSFHWARQADPNAKLFYSDYGIEEVNPRADAAFAMIESMKKDGVPIDGIAFHMHQRIDRPRSPDSIARNLARFAALGLEIEITEFDERIPDAARVTQADLQRQAEVYRSMASICLEQRACSLFETWGFTDKYSWIPEAHPGWGSALYFDEALKPKPAFFGLVSALTGQVGEARAGEPLIR